MSGQTRLGAEGTCYGAGVSRGATDNAGQACRDPKTSFRVLVSLSATQSWRQVGRILRASQLCQENSGTQKEVRTLASPASSLLPWLLRWGRGAGVASDWYPVQTIGVAPHLDPSFISYGNALGIFLEINTFQGSWIWGS